MHLTIYTDYQLVLFQLEMLAKKCDIPTFQAFLADWMPDSSFASKS